MRAVLLSITAFLMLAGASFAAGGDKLFNKALAHYSNSQYARALEYFRLAKDLGVDEKEAELLKNAVAVMEEYRAPLGDIEKDEALLSQKGRDKALSASLYKKHYEFAVNLMRGTFFLAMVEPHFKRMIELYPDSTAAHMGLGTAYYSAMRYDKAVDCYEKAVSTDNANLAARKMAGDACVALGDFDAAKKHYSDLIEADAKAVLKYDASELEKVKKILRALPQTYRDIDAMLDEGRPSEAEDLLKKRISLNQADYIALTKLGWLYQERNDRKNAMRLLKAAVKAAPDYPVSHLYLGRLYFLERDYDNAISELGLFKEKMRLLPKMDDKTKKMYINALYYLSEVYSTLERHEKAKAEVDEILKLDPKEQEAYYILGVYYYKHEHSRSKAYKSFNKVIELEPNGRLAKYARYAIEFMRNNPDSRFVPDFSFIDQEYRD
jgi:tetratricopeptide (TPR) repeat protein